MRYNIGALKYFYLTSDFVDMLKKMNSTISLTVQFYQSSFSLLLTKIFLFHDILKIYIGKV